MKTAAEQIHLDLLQKWRSSMDLIGPGPIEDHFIDSAEAVGDLRAEGQWADLGSGAGFPGIALAAHWPKATVDLIESRHKRAVFLRRVIHKAKLTNVTVRQCRSEDVHERFDGIISRAYKPIPNLLIDAERLCSATGKVVLMLGDQAEPIVGKRWEIQNKKRYRVRDGFRQIWVLKRANGE